MLRTLGLEKTSFISLIGIQSSFFSIPGLIAGIIVAIIFNKGIRLAIFVLSDNYTSYDLTTGAIVLALFFGIFMPLISNILPIYEAISKNLRTSLDLNHRQTEGLTVHQ